MKSKYLKLGDLCKIQSGGTPRRGVEGYYGGDIPWAKIGDIEGAENGYMFTTEETITVDGLASINNKIFPKNTVLLAMYGSVGKTAITGLEMSTNQAILGLQPMNSDILSIKYLKYWLDYSKNNLISKARGVALQNISATIVKDFEIPIIPINEQKRIVHELDTADALRQKRKQSIALLDDYLKAMFLEMFGDPVINPKGWDEKFLEEMYVSKKEGTKCGPFGSALKKDEYVDNGIPVWTMDNIQEGKFVSQGCLYVNEKKYKELEKYTVKNGDIIISRAGTVGKMAIVEGDFEKSIISTNLIKLSLNSKQLLPLYFVSLMNYCKGRVGRLKTGSDGAFTHMNTGVLDSLRFPVPPIDLQEKFAHVVKKTKHLQEFMLAQSEKLTLNFNSLMQINH